MRIKRHRLQKVLKLINFIMIILSKNVETDRDHAHVPNQNQMMDLVVGIAIEDPQERIQLTYCRNLLAH